MEKQWRRYFWVAWLAICQLSSCSHDWQFLHEKSYYAATKCMEVNDSVATKTTACKPGECIPFLFKADELTIEKDTQLFLFGNLQSAKKILLRTRFKFQELRGVAAIPTKVSKNTLVFPVYVAEGLPRSVRDSVRHHLSQSSKDDRYSYGVKWSLFRKYQAEVIISSDAQAKSFYVEDHWLYIPRPLPEGQYADPNCGLSGGGETFIWDGITICHPKGVMLYGEEMFDFMVDL